MKVVFVCTGNTCRSPMLKFMLEDYLKTAGIADVEVDSAGIMRHEKPMSVFADAILDAHGIAHCENMSKYCDENLLSSADFVFAATDEHSQNLKSLYGNKYNVISLSEVIGYGIPDPYGLGLAEYEKAYSLIKTALPKICEYILN